VRLRASTDGGKTWAPSVPVTEQTTLGGRKVATHLDGIGHTAGLAADADGSFQCLWVDGRKGIAQAWTARCRSTRPRKASAELVRAVRP